MYLQIPTTSGNVNIAWPPRRFKIQQFLAAFAVGTIGVFCTFSMLIFICGWPKFKEEYLPLDHFKWPPFVDVRAEFIVSQMFFYVERQMLGEPAQSFIINNWANFDTIIEPNCIGWAESAAAGDERKHKEILVIVKTAPNRLERREAIRSTFGAFKGDKAEDGWAYRIRTVFVMGAMVNWQTNWTAQLREEAHRYGDLLVGNHQDDYFRSCLKFANSIKMARNFCGRQRAMDFVMLLDDDYLLFPWELIKEAQRHSPKERLYAGYCHMNAPAIRNWDDKWAVSSREYPFEQYPHYCSGGTVFLSQRTVEEFYLAIQHAEFYLWEDVYTGFLAHLLHIRAQHIPHFFALPLSSQPSVLICIKGWRDMDWPWCNDWKDVISAHGYSPMEIRQIYPRIQQRWLDEVESKNGGNATISSRKQQNPRRTTTA